MKIKKILVLFGVYVTLLCLTGCSAGLLTRRIDVQQLARPSTSNTTAQVNVQFRPVSTSPGGDMYLSDLEKSIRNGIFNSGQFKEVLLQNESRKQDHDVFFEVTVIPRDNGRTKWAISWPAVYPMCLYWPLQQKEGYAEVLLNIKVITPDKPVQEFSIKKDTFYDIRFYSFFRTGPIEDALQKSYYDAIEDLSRYIRDMSLATYTYEEPLPAIEPGKKINIAVLDLEAISVSLPEARTLTDKLRGELVRTGRFQVLERGQMLDILNEQGFQQSGVCNTDECYVQAGKLLGVEKMLGGSIGKVGNIYLISIRLIEVETGLIIKVVDEEIEGSIDEVLKTGIRTVVKKMSG
jgi:TolB-like protein